MLAGKRWSIWQKHVQIDSGLESVWEGSSADWNWQLRAFLSMWDALELLVGREDAR